MIDPGVAPWHTVDDGTPGRFTAPQFPACRSTSLAPGRWIRGGISHTGGCTKLKIWPLPG